MMNRKIVAFVFLLLAVASSSFAQIGFNSKKIAPFQMKLHTGQPFSAAQLAKGPVVLMFFSPDCGHCQDFTKDLMKNFSVVGNKQLVMITPQSMEMLKQGSKDLILLYRNFIRYVLFHTSRFMTKMEIW